MNPNVANHAFLKMLYIYSKVNFNIKTVIGFNNNLEFEVFFGLAPHS